MHSPPPELSRLRLGHIRYSNCFPVHARFLDRPEAGDPELVDGVPSTLNRLLSQGAIHVAPSSSIEYALHADRYRVMPDLVIGSRGPVRSILLVSRVDPTDLSGRVVAVPTASATSVVLLKILMRMRWGSEPVYRWFDQSHEEPFTDGASAALFIGDVALKPGLHSSLPVRLDLGLEWWEETGLPFAFAIWQSSASGTDDALRRLHALLIDSRSYGVAERADLARRHAARFSMTPADLERYWNDLSYDLDSAMIEGLETFYRLAADIGEVPRVPELKWIR